MWGTRNGSGTRSNEPNKTSASLLHNTFSEALFLLLSLLVSFRYHPGKCIYTAERNRSPSRTSATAGIEGESSSLASYSPARTICGELRKAGSRQSLRHLFSARTRRIYATLRCIFLPTYLPIMTVASQFSASISLPSFGPSQKLWMLYE